MDLWRHFALTLLLSIEESYLSPHSAPSNARTLTSAGIIAMAKSMTFALGPAVVPWTTAFAKRRIGSERMLSGLVLSVRMTARAAQHSPQCSPTCFLSPSRDYGLAFALFSPLPGPMIMC